MREEEECFPEPGTDPIWEKPRACGAPAAGAETHSPSSPWLQLCSLLSCHRCRAHFSKSSSGP